MQTADRNLNKTLAITGVGMVTPIGYDAYTSCASIRADITRLEVLNEFPKEEFYMYGDEYVQSVGGRVKGITDGHLGLSRFSRLCIKPFKEVIASAGLIQKKILMLLALPQVDRPGRDERFEKVLTGRLIGSVSASGNSFVTEFIYDGHASAISAIKIAEKLLVERRADHVIIGGVDSLVEPMILLYLKENERLKDDNKPDGLNPSEGAFFIAVERKETAISRKVAVLATINGISVDNEADTILKQKPATGSALGKVLKETLTNLPQDASLNMIVCDLNGERYRATEWGNASVRALSKTKGTLLLKHHTDCIGDTATASSGISIIYGVMALIKGYAKGRYVLIWASSDAGMRGSLLLERNN